MSEEEKKGELPAQKIDKVEKVDDALPVTLLRGLVQDVMTAMGDHAKATATETRKIEEIRAGVATKAIYVAGGIAGGMLAVAAIAVLKGSADVATQLVTALIGIAGGLGIAKFFEPKQPPQGGA